MCQGILCVKLFAKKAGKKSGRTQFAPTMIGLGNVIRNQNNADGSKNGFKTMPTGQKNGTKTMPAGDYTNPKQCRWVKKTNPKQCRRVKKTEPKQCRRANTRIQCNAVGANCVRPISTEWCAIALKFTLQFLQHPTQFFLSFLQTRNQMLGCF